MIGQNLLKEDPTPWLLEPGSPGVRYLALRDILSLPRDDPELSAARVAAHQEGPIGKILAKMNESGYWVEPGPGYHKKYRSTVWSILFLAQLGASIHEDERISQACSYLLDHALTSHGQFTMSGAPSGTIDCLQGNLCWALTGLGCLDPRLELAYEWMARSITGEGVAPAADKQAEIRYYSYKCGPNFACGVNGQQPCAWGAVKAMMAFSLLPLEQRTPSMNRAIEMGVDFLLSVDPAVSDYPIDGRSKNPSPNWWKLGFPVFFITDIAQTLEALTGLGYGKDPRLENALHLICNKQNERGRWALEYDYKGRTWVSIGERDRENKWVTLRILRLIKNINQ